MRNELIKRIRTEAKGGNLTERENFIINLAISIFEEKVNGLYAVSILLQKKENGLLKSMMVLNKVTADTKEEALGIAMFGLNKDGYGIVDTVVMPMYDEIKNS